MSRVPAATTSLTPDDDGNPPSSDGAVGAPLRMPTSVDRQAEWFASARKGDRAAFGRLAQSLQDRLYNAVYRMTGGRPDDALDLTQETFAKALAGIGDCRGDSQPYTWLFRIAMNLVISKRRKDSVRRAMSLEAERRDAFGDDQMSSLRQRLAGKTPGPADVAQAAETRERVRVALNRLNIDDRALLVMRDVDGMDYAQMAKVIDAPLGTLKSRLFRARMALRSTIEEMERKR